MMHCSCCDFTQRLRREGQPFCHIWWMGDVIGQVREKECSQRHWEHAMIDRAIFDHVHGNGSWFERRLVEVHRVAVERMGEVVTEHLAHALSKMGILVSEEDEDRWSPGMIGRHFGIKAKDVTASSEMGGGVWQAGKALIKQRTHCFLIETAAEFTSGKKCGHGRKILSASSFRWGQ